MMAGSNLRPFVLAALALGGCRCQPAAESPRPVAASVQIPASKEAVDDYAFIERAAASQFLREARQLQMLDPAERAAALTALASDPKSAWKTYVLCRMLFVARAGKEFRPPMLGAPVHVGGGSWEHEPIALQDGIPFVIVTGYALAGQAEPPARYASYCLTNCDWNEHRYGEASGEELRVAAESLIASRSITGHNTQFIRSQVH